MAYTNIDDPSAHFQVAIYTGNATARSITNTGNSNLKPDMVWIKPRNSTINHVLQNSTTGVTKYFKVDKTDVEATASSIIQAFQTNGFSLPSSSSWNQNSQTNVAWQWKAGGGTTSSNSDGDITSTVQANTDAGFSIITYTASGTTDDTIGHGLGVEPDVAIFKRRDTGVSNWDVQFDGTLRATLNLTEAGATNVLSSFSSSTIGLSTGGDIQKNAGGSEYICFAFAAKQGYSKFGKYVGNGNTDGTFVYTGFKPAFVLVKNYSNSGYDWRLVDSARNTFNLTDLLLMPNNNSAEFDGSTHAQNIGIDFLSNGFKCRSGQGAFNLSGGSYIYMAFAENPFVTSTGIPTTAR